MSTHQLHVIIGRRSRTFAHGRITMIRAEAETIVPDLQTAVYLLLQLLLCRLPMSIRRALSCSLGCKQ